MEPRSSWRAMPARTSPARRSWSMGDSPRGELHGGTLASPQSFRAFANSAPYGAAKGGVVQMTRAIAQEWSPYGITCNAIGP
ncbi:SDR family oxidoreductase, partial [Verminephrobacter aporrectodeae]|uniref:SDR family oxidoreductase n=1 Tax=Verminephrobacter aporrectodeae TaxID=1110389 RepID=UPI003908B857